MLDSFPFPSSHADMRVDFTLHTWKPTNTSLSCRSPQDVTDRLDRLIATIRDKYQKPALEDANTSGDILVVAHGHILRAFAMRWAGKSLQEGPTFLLEAGGVGTLRYAAIQQISSVS